MASRMSSSGASFEDREGAKTALIAHGRWELAVVQDLFQEWRLVPARKARRGLKPCGTIMILDVGRILGVLARS